jgi:hypothetical protein
MKLLPLVGVLALASLVPASLAGRAAADDPPPLDCPMCGGNVKLHEKRTVFLYKLQATLVIWRQAHSNVWR